MKQWIKHWMTYPALEVTVVTPDWLYNWIARTAFADPWEDEVKYAARCLVKKLKFPTEKPPALVTIDDRCICFTGKFPSLVQIATFKPWNRLGT